MTWHDPSERLNGPGWLWMPRPFTCTRIAEHLQLLWSSCRLISNWCRHYMHSWKWCPGCDEFEKQLSSTRSIGVTEIIIRPVNAQIDPLICERALWCICVWNSSFLKMTCISAVTERKSYKSWHMWSWIGNASPACHPTSFSSSPIWPICTCSRCNLQLSYSPSIRLCSIVSNWV
jgi:hypothetical protein